MGYVTTADINEFLATSGEDTLIASLSNYSSDYLDKYLNITKGSLAVTATYSEFFTNGYNVHYLNELNSTGAISINDTIISSDAYLLEGRKITLRYTYVDSDTWTNRIKITYTGGYAIFPSDLKLVILNLIGYVYNNKKSQGIGNWKQGELSVQFSKNANMSDQEQMEMILLGSSKYIKNDIYS